MVMLVAVVDGVVGGWCRVGCIVRARRARGKRYMDEIVVAE